MWNANVGGPECFPVWLPGALCWARTQQMSSICPYCPCLRVWDSLSCPPMNHVPSSGRPRQSVSGAIRAGSKCSETPIWQALTRPLWCRYHLHFTDEERGHKEIKRFPHSHLASEWGLGFDSLCPKAHLFQPHLLSLNWTLYTLSWSRAKARDQVVIPQEVEFFGEGIRGRWSP